MEKTWLTIRDKILDIQTELFVSFEKECLSFINANKSHIILSHVGQDVSSHSKSGVNRIGTNSIPVPDLFIAYYEQLRLAHGYLPLSRGGKGKYLIKNMGRGSDGIAAC